MLEVIRRKRPLPLATDVIPARAQHYGLIVGSWRQLDRHAPGGWESRGLSFKEAGDVILDLITTPGVTTVIAVPEGEDDGILGYACYELPDMGNPICHYVFSRGRIGANHKGIAKKMLAPLLGKAVECTHLPYHKDQRKPVRLPKNWTYCP